MIKWHRDIRYFITKAGSLTGAYKLLREFIIKYECIENERDRTLLTCSEENYMLIKLTCPAVIRHDRMA
jgi:hypothetical protein